MKKFTRPVVAIIIVFALATTAVASYVLLGNRFDLPVVGRGVFGVGVSGPVDLLSANGASTTDATFPYVAHPEQLQLGECGIWSDGETQSGCLALWTVELHDKEAGPQELYYRLRLSGPDAQAAAEKLVVAVEATGSAEGNRTSVIYADGGDAMGDGPWYYDAEADEMVTPGFFLGTVTEDTTASLSITAFSMATSEIPGEFYIHVDVYPEE